MCVQPLLIGCGVTDCTVAYSVLSCCLLGGKSVYLRMRISVCLRLVGEEGYGCHSSTSMCVCVVLALFVNRYVNLVARRQIAVTESAN